MDSMKKIPTFILVLAVFVLVAVVYIWRFAQSGPRTLGPIESIHDTAFPQEDDHMLITEKLAHVDVFLQEPVLGKKLRLEVTFEPGNLTRLEVGVRENSFWLSYAKLMVYNHPDRQGDHPSFVRRGNTELLTRVIEIPLTDKLADRDGSVDVMFFATNLASDATEYEGIDDKTLWQLHSLTAEVSPTLPTWSELKDFIKSRLQGERPI